MGVEDRYLSQEEGFKENVIISPEGTNGARIVAFKDDFQLCVVRLKDKFVRHQTKNDHILVSGLDADTVHSVLAPK